MSRPATSRDASPRPVEPAQAREDAEAGEGAAAAERADAAEAPVRAPALRLAVRATKRFLREIPPLRWTVVRFRHTQLRANDAFVVAYPKSGSTWLSGLLAHLATGAEFSFDTHEQRTPGVGDHRRAPSMLPNGGRLLRSHELVRSSITDRYGRVVYMVRDGRDVVVSYFHHFRRLGTPTGGFDAFFEAFLAGNLDGWGSWPQHVRGWLDSPQAQSGRLAIVRYEDLVAQPVTELRRLADFLGMSVTQPALEETARLHTAERMREAELRTRWHAKQLRKDVLFVRRGAPGEFREVLSEAQLRRFEVVAGDELARLGYPPSR